jgi:hypothetical protein
MRTWALWNRSRIVGIIIWGSFVCDMILCVLLVALTMRVLEREVLFFMLLHFA